MQEAKEIARIQTAPPTITSHWNTRVILIISRSKRQRVRTKEVLNPRAEGLSMLSVSSVHQGNFGCVRTVPVQLNTSSLSPSWLPQEGTVVKCSHSITYYSSYLHNYNWKMSRQIRNGKPQHVNKSILLFLFTPGKDCHRLRGKPSWNSQTILFSLQTIQHIFFSTAHLVIGISLTCRPIVLEAVH